MTTQTTDRSEWQVPALLLQTKAGLEAIYRDLPAAEASDFDGEYAGFEYTDKTAEAFAERAKRALQMPGAGWLGKAIRVGADGVAEGYNRVYLPDGEVIRVDQFAVAPGPSIIDGKPALILDYTVFQNPGGQRGTIDEVRRVNDQLFLAFMTATSPDGEGRTEPDFFILSGPPTPWVGLDNPAAEPRIR